MPLPVIAGKTGLSVEWSGFLTAPESGNYLLGMAVDGIGRVSMDGKADRAGIQHGRLADQAEPGAFGARGKSACDGYVWEVAGSAASAIAVGSGESWVSPEALAAAKDADVVVAVVGITSELEGEEMPVSEEGFLGWGSHEPRSAEAGRGVAGGGCGDRQAAGGSAG